MNAEKETGTVVSVHALKYAESTLPEREVFRGGDPEKKVPISFTVYLIRTQNRLILVDAGCDTMPGFVMERFRSPVEVLHEIGAEPDDITDLVLTHAHHDHIDAAHYFYKAVVHIQREEWAAGKAYIPEGFQVEPFTEEREIDGCVTVRRIGGHSPGSSVVLFSYQGDDYLIVGDECYVRDCFVKQIPTGASCCPEKSEAFLRDYQDRIPLFCHDPGIG